MQTQDGIVDNAHAATSRDPAVERRGWQRPRPLTLSAAIVIAEQIGLGTAFAALHLDTGLWAIPAFLPMWGWYLSSAVAGRTLRPEALSKLRRGERLAAVAAALATFALIWPAWATPAEHAWNATESGRFGPLPFFVQLPSLEYGAVLHAAPVALALAALTLVALAMIAMPGRHTTRTG